MTSCIRMTTFELFSDFKLKVGISGLVMVDKEEVYIVTLPVFHFQLFCAYGEVFHSGKCVYYILTVLNDSSIARLEISGDIRILITISADDYTLYM